MNAGLSERGRHDSPVPDRRERWRHSEIGHVGAGRYENTALIASHHPTHEKYSLNRPLPAVR
ncbi:hypothetical protein PUN4_850006 [Paraburkholderia unamae]|nr:hypothetical protein PUN4_850006 [Paraburkholderia unamae]